MIIPPAALTAALPSPLAGSGNAPAKSGSAESFASLIAQISGSAARPDEDDTACRTASSDATDDEALVVLANTPDPSADAGVTPVAVAPLLWNVTAVPLPDVATLAVDRRAAADGPLTGTGGRLLGGGAGRMASNPAADSTVDVDTQNLAGAPLGAAALTPQGFLAGDQIDSTIAQPSAGDAGSQGPDGLAAALKAKLSAPTEADKDGPRTPGAKVTDPLSSEPSAAARSLRRVASSNPDLTTVSASPATSDPLAGTDRKAKGSTAATLAADAAQGRRSTDSTRTDRQAPGTAPRSGSTAGESILQAALSDASRAQNAALENRGEQGRSDDSLPGGEPRPAEADAVAVHAAGSVMAGLAHGDHETLHTTGVMGATAQTASETPQVLPTAAAGTAAAHGAVIDDGSLHRQMVQAIHLQSRNGVGDARLTLRPEYLGEVSIALRVEDGGVTAHISAASAEVREWLGNNESMLRQGLLDQGLKLERLVITEEPAAEPRDSRDRDARREEPQPQDEPRPRTRRNPAATFEITV